MKPDGNSRSAKMDTQPNDVVAKAIREAKLKNARLRHLKESNERYLAEHRGGNDTDEDQTQEL